VGGRMGRNTRLSEDCNRREYQRRELSARKDAIRMPVARAREPPLARAWRDERLESDRNRFNGGCIRPFENAGVFGLQEIS
jgi:hypothetical protein